jgi:homoserine acetyltransferase
MPSDIPKFDDLKMEDAYQTYKLGNFSLKSGGEIPDAFIAYKTLGDPSLPAIIYPTWYSGCRHYSPSNFHAQG